MCISILLIFIKTWKTVRTFDVLMFHIPHPLTIATLSHGLHFTNLTFCQFNTLTLTARRGCWVNSKHNVVELVCISKWDKSKPSESSSSSLDLHKSDATVRASELSACFSVLTKSRTKAARTSSSITLLQI